MNKELKTSFDAPLHSLDSEKRTYGCRQSNPEICGNHSLPDVCAFVTTDGICHKPSRAWKKQYAYLKSKATEGVEKL